MTDPKKVTAAGFELIGGTKLNNSEDLENIVRIISPPCGCGSAWCAHELRILGALSYAAQEAREEGYEKGMWAGKLVGHASGAEAGRKEAWEEATKRMDAIKEEHQKIGAGAMREKLENEILKHPLGGLAVSLAIRESALPLTEEGKEKP